MLYAALCTASPVGAAGADVGGVAVEPPRKAATVAAVLFSDGRLSAEFAGVAVTDARRETVPVTLGFENNSTRGALPQVRHTSRKAVLSDVQRA